MILDDLNEGDFVVIREGDGGVEPGLVLQYHARGERELTKGIVWLSTGRFLDLRNSNRPFLQTLTLISAPRMIPPRNPSFKIVRSFMNRHEHEPKRMRSTLCDVPIYDNLNSDQFSGKNRTIFIGFLDRTSNLQTLHGVISAIEKNHFIMCRRKNDELKSLCLRKFLKDAAKRKAEGVWMNPAVSQACLKFFGIPKQYFNAGRKLVSNYNQLIIQVDGTDSARTLGMHKDRDEVDKPVNTLLGCVAGNGGKDVILWVNYESVEHMPRWWRNEGLSRESFELAKLQCGQVPEIRRQVAVITLNPGQFIFMPKNTYHWVCPSLGASWTVMVTSSFY